MSNDRTRLLADRLGLCLDGADHLLIYALFCVGLRVTKGRSAGEVLREHWAGQGLTIRPGASSERVRRFEQQYDVEFSAESFNYFTTVDGMEGDEWDNDLNHFCSLEQLVLVDSRLSEELVGIPDAGRCFLFVDHCIGVHTFLLQLCKTKPRYDAIYALGWGDLVIAHSLAEFASLSVTQLTRRNF